jgi:hypothetical protein
MIYLSFSTLNDLINEPHTWLCKQMGLEKRKTWQMNAGTEMHQVIQQHVSGQKKDKRLDAITLTFPVVETKSQDPLTHFEIPLDEEFGLHGYVDGFNLAEKRLLEIKTSSKPWGITQFYRLMQWRIYALGMPDMDSIFLITANRELSQIKTYSIDVTDNHREEAKAWARKGINIIKQGDFRYKGEGPSRWCGYINCPFCGGSQPNNNF